MIKKSKVNSCDLFTSGYGHTPSLKYSAYEATLLLVDGSQHFHRAGGFVWGGGAWGGLRLVDLHSRLDQFHWGRDEGLHCP